MNAFSDHFAFYKNLVEESLLRALPEPEMNWSENQIPRSLAIAMRYSLMSPGKRLRPVLLLAACDLMGGDLQSGLPFAVGLEMIHCYSLIHDDLPAMDNDSLRRGKPTNHMVFGESTAILAGDALLNEAFDQMAQSCHPNALKALRAISMRSGARGMIAGQTADIFSENANQNAPEVRYIHEHKTADLMIAAMEAGFILANADPNELAKAHEYGLKFGMAFQIADDLLDRFSDARHTGKACGKDDKKGKATWPSIYGNLKAKEDATLFIRDAVNAISFFGERSAFLKELALNQLNQLENMAVEVAN